MAPINGLAIFHQCEKRIYKDSKMGDLVYSLYKVVDVYSKVNESFLGDHLKNIFMKDIVPVFRRIHKERNLDNIDDMLDFIFNHRYMDVMTFSKAIKTIYFPNEVSNDDFEKTMISFQSGRIIDRHKKFNSDSIILYLVDQMNLSIEKYNELVRKKFKNRWDDFGRDDAGENIFFNGITTLVAAYIYRNNIDINLIPSIYDYLVDNVYQMNVFYTLNKSRDDMEFNKKLEYALVEEMIKDFFNNKVNNKEIIIH